VASKVRVTVDRAKCIANQMCIHNAPGVFRLDADGRSEAYDVDGAPDEVIIEGALACPVSAIDVVDAETGEDLLG
jgi:ferredoxin